MKQNESSSSSWTSGEFLMTVSEAPVVNHSTFSEPAHVLRLTRTVADGEHLLLELPLRTSLVAAPDILRSVVALVKARDRCCHQNSIPRHLSPGEGIAIARANLVRHGWASVWINSRRYATPFVDDWGFAALYADGEAMPTLRELRDAAQPGSHLPPPVVFQTRRVSSSIHMKESWAPWDGGWPFSGTLGNLAALLDPFTHQGVDNVKALIHLLWVDAGAYNTGTEVACIKELRIHSHGNETEILMGDDKITPDNFDASGTVRADTAADALIKALKKLMCKPSKIIFDACSAAKGHLLQNISKNLGPDITVNGFSGLGNPVSEGNTNYINGVKV